MRTREEDSSAKDPDHPDGLRFSILQILPKTMAREEVLRREAVYDEQTLPNAAKML